MRYCRLIVTAHDRHWLDAALHEFTGYASSVIACDVEAGRERYLSTEETPDGRIGAAVLAFAFSRDGLAKSVPARAGQCLMTCPTTAVFNGLDVEALIPLGKHVRFFGDGYQKSKLLGKRRFWRVPVMDGEFVIEEKAGVADGVAGGNLVLQGRTMEGTLAAVKRGLDAASEMAGVIAPFPGVRSAAVARWGPFIAV